MGKITSYIAVFLLSFSTLAQEVDPDAYKMKRKPGLMRYFTGFRAPDKETPEKFDRLNTNITYNDWLGDRNNVKTQLYSLGVDASLMFDVPFSKKSPIGFGIGLGYSFYQVYSNGEFNFYPENQVIPDYTSIAPLEDTLDRWINNFSVHYIEVPFEVRLRLGKNNKFKFYPGFKIGFQPRFTATWRYRNNLKFKEFNFPDDNPLRYGATLRVGFNNFMLYGFYSLSNLFTNNQSSVMQPFSLGISIGWF